MPSAAESIASDVSATIRVRWKEIPSENPDNSDVR
jgi:hypothetical protein